MKIAIITPGGITNFGERAIMLGTIYDLRERYPNAQIKIFGYQTLEKDDPRLFQELTRLGIDFDAPIVGGRTSFDKLITAVGLVIFPRLFLGKQRYQYLKQASIFSKGQESFTQNYGFIHFIDSFLEQLIASRINKGVILLGHSIGPIYKYKWLCALVVNRFAKVYVRDSHSHQALLDLEYDEKKIVDIKDFAYKAVENYNLGDSSKPNSHYLLVPNAAICRTKENKAKYMNNLRILVECLLKKHQEVIIGSSVITKDWNNDYELCEQLKAYYPQIKLRHYWQLHEFLMDVKNAKKIISSRLHPLIMSNGLGTSVLAISRSPKVIGLLGDLDLADEIIDPFQNFNQQQIEELL